METESKRHFEVMWLIGKTTPDHGTLPAFMKNDKKAIKQLFKAFPLLLKSFSLFDNELFLIDEILSETEIDKKQRITKKVENYKERIQQGIVRPVHSA